MTTVHATRAAKGLCGLCGKCQPREGLKRCQHCTERAAGYMKKALAAGNCLRCREKNDRPGKCLCSSCAATSSRTRKPPSSGTCHCCSSGPTIPGKTICVNCRTRMAENRERLKEDVYNAYGGYVCACCRETTRVFLTIDHVNNDGNEHRKSVGGGTRNVFCWIRRNNFPPGFQVLCRNCNWAKHLLGRCPHQQP